MYMQLGYWGHTIRNALEIDKVYNKMFQKCN